MPDVFTVFLNKDDDDDDDDDDGDDDDSSVSFDSSQWFKTAEYC